jgi:hypothetical protein
MQKLSIIILLAFLEFFIFEPKPAISSPSFVRNEVMDSNDDWYYFGVFELGKNKQAYTDEKIFELTNSTIGNIYSVSYISDGKYLNVTFWLTAAFNNTAHPHNPTYRTYIDADSNTETGWEGIDYIGIIEYDRGTKVWTDSFLETSKSGTRELRVKNYTDFDRRSTYVSMSIDLSMMNYPYQYRLLFLQTDTVPDETTQGQMRQITDFANTVHVPSPNFNISMPNSVEVIQGEVENVKVNVKSTNSIQGIEGVMPKLFFYSPFDSDNLKLDFKPRTTELSRDGSASFDLVVKPTRNLPIGNYELPIHFNVSFPSEFFGNPTENITEVSNAIVIVRDPLTIAGEQIRSWFADWFTPFSGVLTSIISVITGILGWRIGKKSIN